MSNYLLKRGKVNSELILLLALIIILFVAITSYSMSSYKKFMVEPSKKNTKVIYNNIITHFKNDTYLAGSAVTASDSLTLFDKTSKNLCKYELKDKNFLRTDNNNKTVTLLENVESVSFSFGKDLPNLIIIRIYPSDKYEIPFFTSFALRGFNK